MKRPELEAVFTHESTTGKIEPGFIALIRNIVKEETNRAYPWERSTWPSTLSVRIRKMFKPLPTDEVILGPNALIIPWPFPGLPEAQVADLEQHLKDNGIDAPPHLTTGPGNDYNWGSDLFGLDTFLTAADELITRTRPSTPPSKEQVVTKATLMSSLIHVPVSTVVNTPTLLRSDESILQGYEESIKFVFGWKNCTRCPMSFADWPCGALCPKDEDRCIESE